MPEGLRRFATRRRLVIAALVAAAAAVAIGVTIGGAAGERVGSAVPQPASPPARKPAPAAPPGFVRFSDQQGRFSIAYPADWEARSGATGDIELLVTKGRAASLLVRSVPLAFAVEPAELPGAKRLTDGIVASGKGVRLLAEARRIELGGLPGWFYFYSFRDGSRRGGTHSHYFLFQGATMITLVFQALPAENFPDYAPTFDRIATSFHAKAR
jgi:hypothetical protein